MFDYDDPEYLRCCLEQDNQGYQRQLNKLREQNTTLRDLLADALLAVNDNRASDLRCVSAHKIISEGARRLGIDLQLCGTQARARREAEEKLARAAQLRQQAEELERQAGGAR